MSLASVRVRIATLALLLWIAVLGTGCRADPTLELRQWTLEQGRAEVPVELPAHLDRLLPPGRGGYTLRTRTTLPDAWRGEPLTLAIPFLEAPAALLVDGAFAARLEQNIVIAGPAIGTQSFRVEGSATKSGTLALALVVDRTSTRGAWLDTVPRLSATPFGDRGYLVARALNVPVAIAAFAVLSTIGFTYFALYLFDRRRWVHALGGLQAVGAAYYMLERLDVPQALFGAYHLANYFAPASGIAAMAFVHAYFGLPRPNAAWRIALVALVPAALLSHGPFDGEGLIATATFALSGAIVVWQVQVLVRVRRAPQHRFSAGLLLAAWAIVGLSSVTDITYLLGFGELADGAHTTVIGLGTYAVVQATVLGRDHIRSLRDADALNVELLSRVSMLEASARQNAILSDELRRQIADRSQRLAEALARIGAVPERAFALSPGDVVQGRYRVVCPLGAGGMGAVHEVVRLTDERHLALKVLTSATTGVALARLAREAQIAAQLSHENLVSIVDVDVSDTGALYLVMELVEGAPLSELGARYGDVPWARDVLRQIATGLAALHAQGVVHRDLKPANILITRAGVAKIADFGIARMGADADTVDPAAKTVAQVGSVDPALAPTMQRSGDAALTGTGVLLGTPLYMAPELARGTRSAGAASDLWAFGVIAYELVTGAFPFVTPPVLDALAGRRITPPRLDAGVVDATLAAILLRCLDADPTARPTAAEVLDSLGLARGPSSVSA